jgi:hypothetical protein
MRVMRVKYLQLLSALILFNREVSFSALSSEENPLTTLNEAFGWPLYMGTSILTTA